MMVAKIAAVNEVVVVNDICHGLALKPTVLPPTVPRRRRPIIRPKPTDRDVIAQTRTMAAADAPAIMGP
jgi:hypothetical protein